MAKRDLMKRGLKFLSSMKFAITMLLILALGSVAGTLLPQNESPAFYRQKYGENLGGLITFTGADHTYTTWWYILLTALLSLSLLLCILKNSGPMLKRIRRQGWKRTTAGIGSWLLHVGMLLLIGFFALSSALSFNTTVYNVPGTVTPISGTDLSLGILDYRIETRDDGSVDDYISSVEILDESGKTLRAGDIRVNHPITVDGYQFTQSSWGYAVDATVLRDGDSIGTAVLFKGEYVSADSGKFFIELVELYPDLVMTELGARSASLAMANPQALYRIYYREEIADMGYAPMGKPITLAEYTVTLDHPRMYTLLAVRKDPFKAGVAAGAGLLILGILVILLGPSPKIGEDKT